MDKLEFIKEEIKILAQEQKERRIALSKPHTDRKFGYLQCDKDRAAAQISAILAFYNELRGFETNHHPCRCGKEYVYNKARKDLEEKYKLAHKEDLIHQAISA